MSDKLIVLLTIVIGRLNTGLSQPTATTERITSDGCGSTKVCTREDGCEPAGNVLCPFASLQVINNSSLDVAFELFGNSSGYIGLVLESDVIQGGNAVFVCSRERNGRSFIFHTAVLSTLPAFNPDIIFKPEVDSVKYNFNGTINSNFRQCSFTARGLRKFIKMTASGNIPVQLSIISGEVTGFGTFQTPPAKLLDKTIHIPVAADCSILKHPLPQADGRFQDLVSNLFPNLDTSEIISNLDPCLYLSSMATVPSYSLTQAIVMLVSAFAVHLF